MILFLPRSMLLNQECFIFSCISTHLLLYLFDVCSVRQSEPEGIVYILSYFPPVCLHQPVHCHLMAKKLSEKEADDVCAELFYVPTKKHKQLQILLSSRTQLSMHFCKGAFTHERMNEFISQTNEFHLLVIITEQHTIVVHTKFL